MVVIGKPVHNSTVFSGLSARGHRNGCAFLADTLSVDDPIGNDQDVGSKILIRIRVYDRDDQLVENYGYENLNLNAPLVDADFDRKNPEYHF